MHKQTTQKRVQFARALKSNTLRVFAVCALVLGLTTQLLLQTQPAQAATPTLNFQARLESSTGAIAPDGYYNVEFKLYQGGTTAGGGTLKWTETYYDSNGVTAGNDNRVRVANGYLTVNLGSLTNFPGTINWDADLFLSMNIGGTTQTATPTYDGEMTPLLKLTSVPYAFQAQSATQLQAIQGGYTGTLAFDTLTASQSILLPNASGTLCLDASVNNCGYLTGSAASGSYIELQATTPGTAQTGNFNISGTGIAGVLQAANINATSGYAYNGTSGASVTCTSGDFLQNAVVQGGIVTGGACVAGGGGSPSGAAGGDLSGTYPNPTVAKIQGTALNISGPTSGQILVWNGTGWTNASVSGDITISSTGVTTIANNAITSAKIADGTVTGTDIASNTITNTNLTAGSFTNITGVGTLTAGTWQGTAITDTYVADALTISSAGSVDWASLLNYPAGCGAGSAIATLGDTPTCSSFVTAEADTLATVTGRGATTATASSFTGGATIRGLTVDTATATQDRILVTAAALGAARFDGTITNADLTVARTWTLPDASGTFITTGNLTGITATGTITSGTWQGTAVGVGYGGTGATTFTQNGILFGNTTGAIQATAAGTTGQCLTGNTGAAPTWGSCGTNGVTTVGTFSASSQANGATIAGNTITFGPADATNPGMVTASGSQTFGGNKTFNGSVTIAASQSFTLTGGITGTRPGSPTEGMLYYDTATKQLLVYSNGKWQSDRSPATKIIAPSNASQAAKDSADVVLTGTADQTLINTALSAAAGGKVYILEGTVYVTGSISVPNNTTLSGAGRGTLITIPNSTNLAINMITNTTTGGSGTGVVIQDLQLDGNRPNNITATTYGVYLNGMGSGTGSGAIQGAKVTNMWINNFKGGAVYLTGSSNNTISNNVTKDDYDRAFSIDTGSNNILSNNISQLTPYAFYLTAATNNTLTGNNAQGSLNDGFRVTTNSNYNTISGNTAQGSQSNNFIVSSTSIGNTFTGNTSLNSATDGFAIYADNNTFTGNTSYNSASAEFDVAANYNTFTGNNLKGTSSSFYGFQLNLASYNVISSNKITDMGGNTTNRAIDVSSNSDSNTITGNNITDTSATTTNYAISIGLSTCDNNYISDNTLGGGSINDVGTGTIYGGQLNSSGNFMIQPSGTIELLKDTNITGNLSASGTINAVSGYKYNGTAGISTTCTSGNLLQNAVIQGGIVTGGTCVAAGGVTTVGTFSASSQANGATIAGNTITFGPADTTNPGMVSTGAQTFAGAKTFQSGLIVNTATATQDRILVTAAALGAARFDGTITNADLTVARTWTLPDASGTFITTGNLTGITATGTVTSGVWQGTAVTDTYVADNITISSAGSVDWTALTNYPAACAAGNALTALGDTVTCSAFLTGAAANGSYVQLQASTPGTAQTGNLNITGTAIVGGLSTSGTASVNLLQATTVDSNAIQTNGTARVDVNGNLINIGTITAAGDATINSPTASATAFRIQNNGTTFFNVDATKQQLLLTAPAAGIAAQFAVQNSAGQNVFTVNNGLHTVNLGSSGAGATNLVFATSGNANTTTLTLTAPTTGRTITLPDATGTVAVSATGNIALSVAGQISLTGQIPIANGGTGASSSQAAINALSQLTTNGDILYNNGTNSTRLARGTTGQCLTSNATTILWGSCSAGISTVGTFSASSQINGATISAGSITFGPADTTNPGMVTASGTQTFGGAKTFTGDTTVQTSTDSATAFVIKSADGTNVIKVDTTKNNGNPITNPSVEVNTTGWNARTGTTLSRTTSAGNYYYGNAAAQAVNTATAGAGINYPIALAPNTTYGIHAMLKMTVNGTVSFGYAADAATETTYVAATEYGGNAGTGWYGVNLVFTTPASVSPSAYIFLKQNDTTARTMYIDGLFAETSGVGQRYQENQINLGDAATKVLIGASPSNTPATLSAALTVQQTRYGYTGLLVKGTPEADLFRGPILDVQNSAGGQVLTVSEGAGNAVKINGGSGFWGSAALTITTADSTAVGLRITGAASQSGNLLQIQDSSSNPLFAVGSGGDLYATNKLAIQSYDAYLRLNPTGAFTSGIYTAGAFRADGEVQSFSANAFRMVQGNYGAFWRNDGTSVYLLSTNGLDQMGGWNANRPFTYNMSTGDVSVQAGSGTLSLIGTAVNITGTIQVDMVGTATTNGMCYSGTNTASNTYNRIMVTCNGTPSDYAEFYPTETNVEAGDVVATTPNMLTYEGGGADAETGLTVDMGTKHISILKKASLGDSSIGIISTAPYATIGKDIPKSAHRLPVAMNGRVPVKVNNEGGPIAAGDQLTLSSVPGYATKATVAGKTIAIALEPFNGTSGSIMVYVQTGYYQPPMGSVLQGDQLSIGGDANIGGNVSIGGQLNASGPSTLASLTVTGDATIDGKLTVVGDIETRNIVVNGHIITAGNAPQVVVGQGAGESDAGGNIAAPIVQIEGNDTSGTITVTAGANGLADVLANITFDQPFGAKPRIMLSPANQDSAHLGAYYDAPTATVNGFAIRVSTAPQAGKTYMFSYFIVQ